MLRKHNTYIYIYYTMMNISHVIMTGVIIVLVTLVYNICWVRSVFISFAFFKHRSENRLSCDWEWFR